jgi:hypothetical protein
VADFENIMAEEFENPRQAFADHRRAQVADVHILGDVGTGVVDDSPIGVGSQGNSEARIGLHKGQLSFEIAGFEHQVDEAGTRDRDLFAQGGDIENLNDRFGDFAGFLTQRFGEGHGDIGLVVAEFWVAGGDEQGISSGAIGSEGGDEGLVELRSDVLEGGNHGSCGHD